MMHTSPSNLPGLTWRQLTRQDLSALAALAEACRQTDGGLGFMNAPDLLQERYFPDAPGSGTGVFDSNGSLAACVTVHLSGDPGEPRAQIVGQVRPDIRGQGIGAYLMNWSQAQAQALPSNNGRRVLQVATESLTAPADRLYRRFGFEPVFEALVMERDLRLPMPEAPFPEGVTLSTWQPELEEQFYQAWYAAFHERPGFPGYSAEQWIARVKGNDLVPEWTLLARQDSGPLGHLIGTIDMTLQPPGGEIWQVGVVPSQRRRGLASALMVESMRRMQAAGATNAELTVHIDNPGAIETYARLGFGVTGRRARYERIG